MAAKPFAFVLMPFDDVFADIYKLGIKSVADECGVIAERVDEQSFSDRILDRIYKQIEAADFIIADMTGRNPNVFYEVGYAHAKDKLCTLLTKDPDDIPFDLKHHRHIIYNGSISTLKEKLTKELKWLKSESEKRKKIPFTIELESADGDLIVNDYTAESKVNFILDIKNLTDKHAPPIEAVYIYTKNDWILEQEGRECHHTPDETSTDSRRHFIKSPISRLPKGGWAQIKVKATKRVWSKWSGDERKDSYLHEGNLKIEILTTEGTFAENLSPKVEVSEIPF